jgi:hypothetical protein
MTNRYRVLQPPEGWPGRLPFKIVTAEGTYGVGDEFEHEFTPDDEVTNLNSGLLELLPSEYKVVGGSDVFEHAPGSTFSAALPLGVEALLVAGGHIERVEPPPPEPPKSKSKVKE